MNKIKRFLKCSLVGLCTVGIWGIIVFPWFLLRFPYSWIGGLVILFAIGTIAAYQDTSTKQDETK